MVVVAVGGCKLCQFHSLALPGAEGAHPGPLFLKASPLTLGLQPLHVCGLKTAKHNQMDACFIQKAWPLRILALTAPGWGWRKPSHLGGARAHLERRARGLAGASSAPRGQPEWLDYVSNSLHVLTTIC